MSYWVYIARQHAWWEILLHTLAVSLVQSSQKTLVYAPAKWTQENSVRPMMNRNSVMIWTPIIGIARRITLPSIPSIGRICAVRFPNVPHNWVSGYWRNPALFRYSDWLEHQIALGTGRLSLSLSLCSDVDLARYVQELSELLMTSRAWDRAMLLVGGTWASHIVFR
jgi:hypothetical protein